MLRTEILQQLNEMASSHAFAFPYFSSSYPINVRLSAYRTKLAWAIFIETLVFWTHGVEGHLACNDFMFCYGNNLPQSPGAIEQDIQLTGDGPSGPLFDSEDITQLQISPTAVDMTIRGNVVPITTDPAVYAAAGIQLKEPPKIFGYELLRLIAPKYRRLFFATEEEIVERIGQTMPLLLRLDEWRHPDLDKGETPADSESFQMIADVIAHNNPSLYKPTQPPNTHWSNWPMAGMI